MGTILIQAQYIKLVIEVRIFCSYPCCVCNVTMFSNYVHMLQLFDMFGGLCPGASVTDRD